MCIWSHYPRFHNRLHLCGAYLFRKIRGWMWPGRSGVLVSALITAHSTSARLFISTHGCGQNADVSAPVPAVIVWTRRTFDMVDGVRNTTAAAAALLLEKRGQKLPPEQSRGHQQQGNEAGAAVQSEFHGLELWKLGSAKKKNNNNTTQPSVNTI